MEQPGPRETDEPSAEEVPVDEASTEDREWQFGLDDVGPDGVIEEEPDPIEPETPRLENVIFVLLGVVGTLFLLSTVI
jgi:hypothetical protein